MLSREPAVAGTFYPDNPKILQEQVDSFLSTTNESTHIFKGRIRPLKNGHSNVRLEKMMWITITAVIAGLGAAIAVASMALWVRRLRPLKEMLTTSRMFREKPWVGSDTGFQIFSEMLAGWSVRILIVAFAVAFVSILFAPEQTRGAFLVVFGVLLLRSITTSIWSHARAKVIHRDPQDDESGVFGMAEINWHKRRNVNAIVATATCIPIVLLCLTFRM